MRSAGSKSVDSTSPARAVCPDLRGSAVLLSPLESHTPEPVPAIVQARIWADGFPMLDQTTDYSFNPNPTQYTDWTHTLYQNGNLVWGVEP
jgi:hypothetical protein